jgi:hypothetical protein
MPKINSAAPKGLSVDLEFISRGTIYVPKSIVAIMSAFCRFASGNEYGIFLCSDINREDFSATVQDVWVLPDQSVSPAAIHFNEHREDISFNTICHRHPTGCNSFSSTDNEYINQDFDVSFIFQEHGVISDALINFQIAPLKFLRLVSDVVVFDDETHNVIPYKSLVPVYGGYKNPAVLPLSKTIDAEEEVAETKHVAAYPAYPVYASYFSRAMHIPLSDEDIKHMEEDGATEELFRKKVHMPAPIKYAPPKFAAENVSSYGKKARERLRLIREKYGLGGLKRQVTEMPGFNNLDPELDTLEDEHFENTFGRGPVCQEFPDFERDDIGNGPLSLEDEETDVVTHVERLMRKGVPADEGNV